MDDLNGSGPESPNGHPADADEHRIPRWVVGFVIAGVVVIVLVVLALALGGDHGPGRHLPSGQDAAPRTLDPPTPPVVDPR